MHLCDWWRRVSLKFKSTKQTLPLSERFRTQNKPSHYRKNAVMRSAFIYKQFSNYELKLFYNSQE